MFNERPTQHNGAEGEGQAGVHYDKKILDLVEQACRDMVVSGENEKLAPFGRMPENSSFWISRDSGAIVDPANIEVDGTVFYFGLFKKEKA